jgi:hypothetical protein
VSTATLATLDAYAADRGGIERRVALSETITLGLIMHRLNMGEISLPDARRAANQTIIRGGSCDLLSAPEDDSVPGQCALSLQTPAH